jgi:hypothetical protein
MENREAKEHVIIEVNVNTNKYEKNYLIWYDYIIKYITYIII